MMPIGQFGVDGCHLIDGGRAQCGLGDHQGGRQGGGWRQYMLLEHWEITVVIEMVVGELDDREVHKVGKVVTREWWNV